MILAGNQILLASGAIQLFVGVLLGWAVFFHRSDGLAARLFPNRRRLLQTHLDDIMMGGLQLAIAAAFPTIPFAAAILLVVGSWTNAKIFLVLCIFGENAFSGRIMQFFPHLSFSIMTVGYGWLLVHALHVLIVS